MKWIQSPLGRAYTTINDPTNRVLTASINVAFPPKLEITVSRKYASNHVELLYSKDILLTRPTYSKEVKEHVEAAKAIAEEALKWYANNDDSIKHNILETFTYVMKDAS